MNKLSDSFRFAFRGLFLAVKRERNVKIHLLAVVAVTVLGFVKELDPWGWAAVFLCFGLVLAAELVNTAIEMLCDRVCPEKDEKIRDIKDITAGAVLITAIVSILVAIIVFII